MSWSLRRKILVGYGFALLLLLVVLGWALLNLVRLGQAGEAILSENYESILAADRMVDALERQDSAVLLLLLGDEAGGRTQFRENAVAFRAWYARAAGNITIDGEAAKVAAIDSAYATYHGAVERLRDQRPPPAAAPGYYKDSLFPRFWATRHLVTGLRELNQRTAYEASERTRRLAHRAFLSIALLGSAALAFGLALSIVLANRISRPVRELEDAARRIASGDYDVAVPAGATDEIGRLALEFTAMAAALRTYRALETEKTVRAQRMSDAVLQSIDDGVVVLVDHAVVADLNPVAARALGTTPEEARGKPLNAVTDHPDLLRAVADADAPANTAHAALVTLGTPPRDYQPLVTPIGAQRNPPLGSVLLLRDVTDLRRLDRLKSEFVATASHELRTPLTSIGMSIALLREGIAERLSTREQELLHVAAEEAARLRSLVNDLLDLSRIEAGQLELDCQFIDAGDVISRAAAPFHTRARESGVTFEAVPADRLPPVYADSEKAERVLVNLISNALRHTPPGGTVRVSAQPEPGAVRFVVADTGDGIADADQARIFDKFVRIEGARSAGGTGLGLSIAREIVDAHGGDLRVESAPGAGSTFSFTLPTAAVTAA